MRPLINLTMGDSLIQIHTYALLISLALFIMFITLLLGLKQSHLSVPRIILGTVATLVMAIVGSRILYYVLYPPNDSAGYWAIIRLNFFGFTLYGGILAAVMVLWGLSKIWGFRLFQLMDYMLVGTGIGFGVSRLGCWFNGCCYGNVTEMPWGIHLIKGGYAYNAYVTENPLRLFSILPTIHPTQLYELFVVIIALSVGAFMLVKKKAGWFAHGVPSIVFGMVLTVGRFIVFQFRAFPYATTTSNTIRGPITYGVTLVILVFFLRQAIKVQPTLPHNSP